MLPTVYFTLGWNKKLFTFLKSVMGNNFKFPRHEFLPNDLTINDFLNNLDLPWDWNSISCNKFELDFFEKHPELPWDYERLIMYNRISSDFIEKHIDLPWNYEQLSSRDNLPMEFVMKHMDKPWNWNEIFKRDYNNASFFEIYDCEVDKFHCHNERNNFKLLFKTNLRKITTNDPHFSSTCKDLTLNMVLNNIDLKWNWNEITMRDFVTMDVIKNNPDLP